MTEIEANNSKNGTRSLIQLGGLVEKAGLLKTFEITLGRDFQNDPNIKLLVAALFKGLLELNQMAQSDGVPMSLWRPQGLKAFDEVKKKRI